MRNHHNQSDNAPYYVISRVSFQARVFCINRLSHYEGGGMTHTWRKVTQILYLALINRLFFSLLKHTVTFIKNLLCFWGNARRCGPQWWVEAPFAQGAFRWSEPASSESVNCEHRRHSFSLVSRGGRILSINQSVSSIVTISNVPSQSFLLW